jgi:hypothetical protein
MEKTYIVLSTWFDKHTGLPKSTLAELSRGINKNGKSYQITDTNKTMTIDEAHNAGTILTFNLILSTTSQTKQSMKLNTAPQQ